MTKRKLNLLRAGRRRRWSAAVTAAVLFGSAQATVAQSVLRFVGPDDVPSAAATILPQQTAPAPVPATPGSEFRFVELSEGKVAPLPQFSVSTREVVVGEQSTLRFAPAVGAQAPAIAVAEAQESGTVELHFKPYATPVAAEHAPITNSAPRVIAVEPMAPARAPESATQQFATELFAKPLPSQASPFKPRIAVAVEHVPASVPQHVDAQPVRSMRTVSQTYAAPAGSELFASGAPTVAASEPKGWNLPALDYGSALRQVQPVQPPVLNAEPIAPTRVVARELPSDAADMFGLGAPEPLIAQTPVAKPALVPAAPVRQTPVQSEPVLAEQKPLVVPQLPAVQMPQHIVVEAKPTAKPVEGAPVAADRIVTATAKLGAASELEFSALPASEQPPKAQFAAAAPAPAAKVAPRSTTAPQPKLVPAAALTTSQPTAPSFAYQPGPLAGESHVAEYKPAPVAPPVIHVPDRSQVVATVDAWDPNTYSLSYATTSGAPPAMYANSMEPMAAEGVPGPTEASGTMPLPCNCGAGPYGQCGCPYLPGQSGTRALCGVDCGRCGAACNSSWSDATCIPWALLGPGEYIGPARPAHVETYYLRVNDVITLTFIESRKKSAEHYRIGVGDRLQIEWLQGAANSESALNRELLVQPDGTVTLPLIGEVNASGKTINDFRDEVIKLYSKFQREPQITITPLTVNVAVQDVLKAVTAKNQSSGQTQDVKVTPEGTIQAAGIGSVYAQGLTLDELRNELEARYAEAYGPGLSVSPQLTERATSYVFIGGEVKSPGRYVLEGPTTVMQAVAMAGSWNNGGNLRQIVIFRRDENWCLKATKIDVRGAYYGKDPCPMNDVWLRDNDLVIVPKSCILCATDLINLYFTRGIYAVFPISYVYDFSQNSGIVPITP